MLETSDISTDNFECTLKSDDFDFPVPEISCEIISSTKDKINLITTDSENLEKYYKELEDGNWQVFKKYENIIREYFSDDVIYAISEYDISDATEKLGLRGFYVYTDKIHPKKLIIDKYENIILVNYDQFVVSDIDSDGEDELITRLGYGFGRYIITLSAFKYNSKEMVMLCKTQYEQTSSLDMFIRQNNGNVEVIAGQQKNGEIVVSESYGNLEINNGVLRPRKKDIPFKVLK